MSATRVRRVTGAPVSRQAVRPDCCRPQVQGMSRFQLPFASLEQAQYLGWYKLEQDVAPTDEHPSVGQGPVLDLQHSIEYLQTLAA